MKLRPRPQKKARIEIIPMIDVIFFLLVFFMVSSLAMTNTQTIAVNLPKTELSSKALKPKFVVSVKKDGSLFLNSKPVALDSIGSLLAYEMRENTQEPVVIHADQGVSYGHVMNVMDAARKIGVRKFSLAAESTTRPQSSAKKM